MLAIKDCGNRLFINSPGLARKPDERGSIVLARVSMYGHDRLGRLAPYPRVLALAGGLRMSE